MRMLLVPLCFLVLSLPLVSGMASDPGIELLIAVFVSWVLVAGVLLGLALGSDPKTNTGSEFGADSSGGAAGSERDA